LATSAESLSAKPECQIDPFSDVKTVRDQDLNLDVGMGGLELARDVRPLPRQPFSLWERGAGGGEAPALGRVFGRRGVDGRDSRGSSPAMTLSRYKRIFLFRFPKIDATMLVFVRNGRERRRSEASTEARRAADTLANSEAPRMDSRAEGSRIDRKSLKTPDSRKKTAFGFCCARL
jgi:hypothetical protein